MRPDLEPALMPAVLVRRCVQAVLFVAGTIVSAGLAKAEPLFAVRNEAALSRATALPTLGDARVLDNGSRAFSVRADWSNEFVNQETSREALLFDGETQRITFGFKQGIAPGVEVGIDVPLIATGGGVLDSVIEGWHGIFNLANGGREFVPQDRYRYRYTRDGQTLLDVQRGAEGIGDVELNLGFAVREDFALRALAKLPTGRGSRLQGGNAGGAIWFDYDPFALALGGSPRWLGFVSGGVSYNDEADQLGALQRPLVALGGLGLGYRVLPSIALIGQFNAHTALYKTADLRALSGPGGQLAFGGRITLSPRAALDLGVQEDVLLNSSPDFSIHVGVHYR